MLLGADMFTICSQSTARFDSSAPASEARRESRRALLCRGTFTPRTARLPAFGGALHCVVRCINMFVERCELDVSLPYLQRGSALWVKRTATHPSHNAQPCCAGKKHTHPSQRRAVLCGKKNI